VKIPVGIPVFVAAAGTDPRFAKLVHRYLFSSAFWLLVAGIDGLLLAFKLVDPTITSSEYLFFGRLRPVHVLTMLFGWASLALVALALYVVPKASRVTLDSFELTLGNIALALWNVGVLVGGAALILGHTTGREYREYPIWAMAFIAAAVVILGFLFYRLMARRRVEGIYISCWFIVAACVWATVTVIVGYWPAFRVGIADTVAQGYYMHNVVGMWFTPMVVGITYYTLPKLLNKPIYSYGLGVLGFFTHLAFYTVIGAHHFIYSPLPDWLETTGVVFSVAMIVPVWASTGNFLLTMRGEHVAISHSYSLPFILTGVIAYGLVSLQGSAQALRNAQEAWHFTHYTVGHSHFAMYGFVTFLVWGSIYGLVPRITGREPPVLLVGIHFWLALAGIVVYIVPLWLGGSEQGAAWIRGLPFMDSVRTVMPHMVWRAVGGTFMFLSHMIFFVCLFRMRPGAFTFAFATSDQDKAS
jgi:cytochrome c oxidase cbb3-type subunit 1